MTRGLQNVALILLGAVAGWTTYLAVTSVGGPTPQPAGRFDATATAAPDEMAADRRTATATTSSDEDQDVDALEAARAALASGDPLVITVLGDSTSNERSEWVHLWAAELARSRPVSISHWNEATGTVYNEADVLSEEGDGGPVTIWSGSVAGANGASAASLLPGLLPQRPDFAVYSFGHNSTLETVTEDMAVLHARVSGMYPGVPTVVVLQNPQVDDANVAVREAVRAWAEDEGLGVLDVAAAFQDAGELLLVDNVHPSAEGQQLWADVVAEALG